MIYDCFIFFNELELLELRLNELNDVVDRFVIVESTKTFQGKDKPLYFNENINRFQKFTDKIIHVIVDQHPEVKNTPQILQPWLFEYHQRNEIIKGLIGCKPDDVILISDVDEIPRPDKIIKYKDADGIKIFIQRLYYYFLNCISMKDGKEYKWTGTVMVYYKDIATPQKIRDLSIKANILHHQKGPLKLYSLFRFLVYVLVKHKQFFIFIDNGGWHFSYLGGVQKIIEKIESFAHTEYNKNEFKSPEIIKKAINSGRDIFGRNLEYKIISIDETFPLYIIKNPDRFRSLIFKEEST